MRCPDCNKFVSIEMAEPETELEVDADGNVTGTACLTQTCADCGGELAEAVLDVEAEVEIEHTSECKQDSGLEIEASNVENDDRFEGKGRGAKHFYGASIQGSVKCSECGAEAEFEVSVEQQASSFDSLV